MKLPLSWLSDYTDMTGITPKEYDAKLTMSRRFTTSARRSTTL